MNNLRKIAAVSLAAVLAFSMAACGSDGTGESTGKAVTVNEKSAKATSLADFGTMEDLEKAAKEEGALNVIALPHDWSNYGEVIESFKKKYPEIKVTELNPNASSKEELDAAGTDLSAFADGDLASSWSRGAFAWAAAKGLVQGYDEPTGKYLRPGDPVARERVAVVLMRAFEMGVLK